MKLSLGLFACLLMLMLAACAPTLPPDETLLSNYRTHRVEFGQLQTMLLEDRGQYMNQRYEEYLSLRQRIGVQKFVGTGAGPTGFRLPVATAVDTFQLTHGQTKGYAWLSKPPTLLAAARPVPQFGVADRLDGQKLPRRPYIMALRHIEGPWYLYVDNDPFRPVW